MIQEIKTMRVRMQMILDGIVAMESKYGRTREISLAITKGQQARHFLGEMLKSMDVPTPYAESKDPSTGNVIAPPADMPEPTNYETIDPEWTPVQWIKATRASMTMRTNDMQMWYDQIVSTGKFQWNGWALSIAIQNWVSSCHWMGELLGRIRDGKVIGYDASDKKA